jgi:hypothetical protein
MKRIWVWDLETLDIFTATFLDRDSDETRIFVIDNELDDKEQMFEFLDNEVAGLIGLCIEILIVHQVILEDMLK